jgi:hypothetical protein
MLSMAQWVSYFYIIAIQFSKNLISYSFPANSRYFLTLLTVSVALNKDVIFILGSLCCTILRILWFISHYPPFLNETSGLWHWIYEMNFSFVIINWSKIKEVVKSLCDTRIINWIMFFKTQILLVYSIVTWITMRDKN